MIDTHVALSHFSLDDEWFQILAETTSAAILIFSSKHFLFANSATEAITGYSVQELLAMQDPWRLVTTRDRATMRRRAADRLRGKKVENHYRVRICHRTGDDRWVEVSANRIQFNGEPATIATVIDVTDHLLAEEALSREKELTEITLASIGDGVLRTDSKGQVDYMNPIAERLTGRTLSVAEGLPVEVVYRVVNEGSRQPRRSPFEVCFREQRTVVLPGLFTLQSHSGEEFIIRDSVAPIRDSADRMIGTVLVFRDLTRLRGLEQQMVYLASHDSLTGLLNRQEFEIHLEAALESARDRGAVHTLAYLAIMELKLVNDCYGLVAGDELLRQVAEQLREVLEGQGSLGRMGGNDFALLLENQSVEFAQGLSRKVLHRFQSFRFSWGGQLFSVGFGIGLVPIKASTESVTQIFKAADAACYLARQNGRNKIHAYASDDSVVAEHHGRLHRLQKIRRALEEGRLCLYYQEIRPFGEEPGFYELLLRMVDEDGKHIAPGAFIPVAEDHDLVSSIDRWVVRESLRLLSQEDSGPLRDAAVSINLSGLSIGEEAFLEDIIDYLEGSGIDTGRLFFEITETAAVAHLPRALRLMEALKDRGCRFILDDFGSGFSSFAYLKSLPVDMLKIDGEFVRSMGEDKINYAMVEAINQIGQVMGLKTIAEWVETETTYNCLNRMGVDFVQGFWVHRPTPIKLGP